MSPNPASETFAPAPSLAGSFAINVDAATSVPSGAQLVGVPVGSDGAIAAELGFDRATLEALGFNGDVGSAQLLPATDGPPLAAVGIGAASDATPAVLRDAGGAFGRASGTHDTLAVVLPDAPGVGVADAAQAVVEGVLLSRYSYDALRAEAKGKPIATLTLVTSEAGTAEAKAGAQHGRVLAAATMLARDLANSPHNHLSATKLANLAIELGAQRGLSVEVFDKDQLIEMGCGGLLGVNAGSVEPPRMIKLAYRPEGEATGHLAFVGKGIMYDSGGIALKPADEVHAQMKNDMTGAAACFAALCVLGAAECRSAVTAFLACTDNMPSGTAMALGDVIRMRDGTTVEVINTDAEGRLVMADALALATEESPDAIVDIATLTGACMRALGTGMAGVMGTNQDLVEQVKAAGEVVDEPVWQLPLEKRYRDEIVSAIADLRNMGKSPNGGAIHAALFLAEFVGDIPFAHIDIAGTAQTPADKLWHTTGCSGFGARLLAHLATNFTVPAR
jgi:leucyl aminopeptidase